MQLKQGATVLRTTGYAWDNADQITSQTVNGVTTNYGYDLAGQLTSEVRSGYNVAYTYDANGNRLSKTVNGTVESYTYDLADKMLTAGAKSYTYDAAGRTVGINAPGGTTTLSYDYESRVTAISGPGINETHTYNGLDTRVGTVQGGVSRTFVRDGSYVTDPALRDGQATYTPGVSERRGGVSTWSHSGLKNADAQTSSVGAIQATRVYDAFGAELSATGTWKGPFGYAGGFGYQEDSSGLKLLGHRYYDPTTGRFLSRDPAKDGWNWYVYCGNDPITSADGLGLSKWRILKKGVKRAGDIPHIKVRVGRENRENILVRSKEEAEELARKMSRPGHEPVRHENDPNGYPPHWHPGPYKNGSPHIISIDELAESIDDPALLDSYRTFAQEPWKAKLDEIATNIAGFVPIIGDSMSFAQALEDFANSLMPMRTAMEAKMEIASDGLY